MPLAKAAKEKCFQEHLITRSVSKRQLGRGTTVNVAMDDQSICHLLSDSDLSQRIGISISRKELTKILTEKQKQFIRLDRI